MLRLGLRREDKSPYERRVALVPRDVRTLVAQGCEILVERSQRRCVPDAEFEAAGARLVDDVDAADVILGVKEIPVDKIARGKTYLFFSHTIKGQPYNMPLLKRILDQGCSLLDYELITDDDGIRTVAFGRHAGLAGAVDTLHALGQRLKWREHETPLADIPTALDCEDIDDALTRVAAAGDEIRRNGLPSELSPLVIGVTGEGGKVFGGAMEVLDALPARIVEAEDLADAIAAHEGPADEIWAVAYGPGDLVERTAPGEAYEWEHYLAHPDEYRECFSRALPHLTAVIHGIFWAEGYPRFILADRVREMFAEGRRPRLELITDITCDLDGSNELLAKITDPGSPSYVWRPDARGVVDGIEGEGVALWAVDILPAEFPRDASRHFSRVLTPLIPSLLRDDAPTRPADPDFPAALRGAFLCVQGELLPEWAKQLNDALAQYGDPS